MSASVYGVTPQQKIQSQWMSADSQLSTLLWFTKFNAGYTIFRGSVKSTVYPFHSPVSPSIAILCVSACHHISTGLYQAFLAVWRLPPSVRNRKNYFALSTNSLRTANRWQCAPHHREMFWCKEVASSLSPPGVACHNCPVWSSSHPHPQKPFSKTLESRCL